MSLSNWTGIIVPNGAAFCAITPTGSNIIAANIHVYFMEYSSPAATLFVRSSTTNRLL
jgi:hypothetical protein